MNQHLDTEYWIPIKFEGELLPQSVSGLSILIHQDFTDLTKDWIWSLPHCSEVWKSGAADWCLSSASEISNYLLKHKTKIITEIQERLSPHGFDADITFSEWITALSRIRQLAESSTGECSWIAGEPTELAEEVRLRIMSFLDKCDPA